MDKLIELYKRCKCSVSVTINNHRDIYQSAEDALLEMEGYECPPKIEDDVRAEMIKRDTIIDVQFYPNTPIGFCNIYHWDLDAALSVALGLVPLDKRVIV